MVQFTFSQCHKHHHDHHHQHHHKHSWDESICLCMSWGLIYIWKICIYHIYHMYLYIHVVYMITDSKNIIIILEMNSSGCACLGAVFTRALTLTSRACAFWRKLTSRRHHRCWSSYLRRHLRRHHELVRFSASLGTPCPLVIINIVCHLIWRDMFSSWRHQCIGSKVMTQCA